VNKLNILFLFIIFNTNILHCMKRQLEITTTSIKPSAKRQKTNNQSTVKNQLPTALSFDNSTSSLVYNIENASLAEEAYKGIAIQANYINAIQKKSTADLLYWLEQKPRLCCLGLTIQSNFTEGSYALLANIQPHQSVLDASLAMAIGSQNIPLVSTLLNKGAQIKITKNLHPMVRKILNENKEIVHLITQQYVDLQDAVEAGLEEVVRAILKKTRPHQFQLNQSLHSAAEQQNFSLATMLIEAGATIQSCIK
jgi:hypothetical protein